MTVVQLITTAFFGIAAGGVMFAFGMIILSPKDVADVFRFLWRTISRKGGRG
jgi:hypothetical protein